MTQCEVCNNEIKNDERREHRISEKHLKNEAKNFCQLCNLKCNPKTQTSYEFNKSFYNMGCGIGHSSSPIHTENSKSLCFFLLIFTINQTKNFTIDMAAKSESLNSNSILRLYKQNFLLKIMEIKSEEPKLTQKQNSNQLVCSDSTINRYRDDTKTDSPNEKKINTERKTTKQILL